MKSFSVTSHHPAFTTPFSLRSHSITASKLLVLAEFFMLCVDDSVSGVNSARRVNHVVYT
ncbi:MAG: hypothetical protein QXE28_01855 [Desulfurococcaceae archaeon]